MLSWGIVLITNLKDNWFSFKHLGSLSWRNETNITDSLAQQCVKRIQTFRPADSIYLLFDNFPQLWYRIELNGFYNLIKSNLIKEANIMWIFCSIPNLISEMSLSLRAGRSTLEWGKFTPLWDPRAPELAWFFHLAWFIEFHFKVFLIEYLLDRSFWAVLEVTNMASSN